jgi:hypothetical protein
MFILGLLDISGQLKIGTMEKEKNSNKDKLTVKQKYPLKVFQEKWQFKNVNKRNPKNFFN